ncbi:MAG: exodeoxyribonuclease VII large subunit, partial [Prevotella sp.]|nr:exodeoxyribonuclease VII large subunit [Prevotella sp.]
LRLTTLSEKIPMLFSLVKTRQTTDLDRLFTRLTTLVEKLLTAEHHRLELIRRQAENLDPMVPLRRGYSMTLFNGKIVRDPKSLQSGDDIVTKLENGPLKSIVK